mgnify:CR=1 FL=1
MPKIFPKHVTIEEPVLLFDSISGGSNLIELFTLAQTAEILKISESSVRRLQKKRKISFYKVGGSLRFAKNDLMSYLKKQRVEPID